MIMAHIVMAYIVTACVLIAYIVMARSMTPLISAKVCLLAITIWARIRMHVCMYGHMAMRYVAVDR